MQACIKFNLLDFLDMDEVVVFERLCAVLGEEVVRRIPCDSDILSYFEVNIFTQLLKLFTLIKR